MTSAPATLRAQRKRQAAGAGAASPAWATLYRAGGAAALIAAVLFRRNIAAEVSLFSPDPIPTAAADWFALLQDQRLVGLAYLNVFDVVNYALLGLMFLALYIALRRTSESTMLVAVTLGIVAAAVSFASNQAFAVMELSERYAAAPATAQPSLLAAGEALLAAERGTGSYLSLLCVALAGLLTSIVMLRGHNFGRVGPILGIVGNVLVLLVFPVLIVVAPDLVFLPHTLAAIPLIVWQFLAGLRLLRLAGRA